MTAPSVALTGNRQGGLRRLADVYATVMRTAVAEQFQYRTANYAYMVGVVIEPVVYLVVWTTVAESQGGTVGGLGAGDFAAYYIVWTLVRNMNIVFTPYGWEERIRTGELSAALLRPLHPLHYDVAYFAGWKIVVIVLWLPLAAVLTLVFRPALHVTPLEVLVFTVAIWGAYLIRTMFLWALGMITFWTTRVTAIYELWFAGELLLSGRLVPLVLMPGWVTAVASFTPFPSTFGFPIEALAGDLGPGELLRGLAVQGLWIGLGVALVSVLWRVAIRRYSAVGN